MMEPSEIRGSGNLTLGSLLEAGPAGSHGHFSPTKLSNLLCYEIAF